MKPTATAHLMGALYFVVASVGASSQPGCRGDGARADTATAGPVDAAPHSSNTAGPPGDAAAPATAEQPDRSLESSGGASDWLDGTLYRFRVRSVRPCPDGPDGVRRLAVRVELVSQINDLLVAPRDVHLKAGGVILDAATVIPSAATRQCGAPLEPRSLPAGKSAQGIVLFAVPPGFAQASGHRVQVTYQPTRWGGARAVSATLPSAIPLSPAR